MLVWSEGEASSGEEGEPAASLDNWSNFARLEKETHYFKHTYIYTKTLAQVSWRQGVQKGRVRQLSAFSVLTEQAICQHLPQMHNNDNFF